MPKDMNDMSKNKENRALIAKTSPFKIKSSSPVKENA
jgi:hypothetical protein